MIQFCDSNGDFVGYSLASYAQVLDPVTCAISYVLQANYYDTDWVSLGSSLPVGWEKCCCDSTGSITETLTFIANTIVGHKIGDYTNENSVTTDIFETVTSLAYNAGTNELTFTDETGTDTTIDLTALAVDVNVASVTYNPVTGEIVLTETDSTVHTIDIGPPVSQFDITDGTTTETVLGGDTITFNGNGVVYATVSPTDTVDIGINNGPTGTVLTGGVGGPSWQPGPADVCTQVSAYPLVFFNQTEHSFIVKNINTGACERTFPSFPGANWTTTYAVGGLVSGQAMNQAVSGFQNFPGGHLAGSFNPGVSGGFSNQMSARLDFNFQLYPSAQTFPAGAWADRYVIGLRVLVDGVAVTHTISSSILAGEEGNGNLGALVPPFTAYPEYGNYHFSVRLGTTLAPAAHTFAVQYQVVSNTLSTGHTRTVNVAYTDWLIEMSPV